MNQSDNNQSKWPYSSLILFGFFGSDSPGGRRLAVRSLLALILFIAGFIGAQFFESAGLIYVSAALMPLSILFLVYSNIMYLKSLDSLERLIQLTAFAASYGAILIIAISIYAFNLVTCCPLPLVLVLLAEPIRATCLYFIAKSYE